MLIDDLVKHYTLRRLRANKGCKRTTARELGISFKTLYN